MAVDVTPITLCTVLLLVVHCLVLVADFDNQLAQSHNSPSRCVCVSACNLNLLLLPFNAVMVFCWFPTPRRVIHASLDPCIKTPSQFWLVLGGAVKLQLERVWAVCCCCCWSHTLILAPIRSSRHLRSQLFRWGGRKVARCCWCLFRFCQIIPAAFTLLHYSVAFCSLICLFICECFVCLCMSVCLSAEITDKR